MQRSQGNGYAQRLLRVALQRACSTCREEEPSALDSAQAKLDISQPDDPAEVEAERVAEEVTQTFSELPQMGGEPTPAATSDANTGRALDSQARAFFEPRFGRDFSDVRVHVGSEAATSAREFAARAYTVGSDIVFGAGEYAPETRQGRRLLAHELTHVVQHGRARPLSREIRAASAASPSISVADAAHHRVQRQDDHSGQPRRYTRPQLLTALIGDWRRAGLLDAPFRPDDVGEFPPMPAPRTGTMSAGAAPLAVEPLPADPIPGRVPFRVIPGGGSAPAGGPAPAPVPAPPPALPLLVFLIVLLWPSETAPAWLDTISRVTGEPYGSPEEYEWEGRLSPVQVEYLQHLMRARQQRPDPETDGEGDPTAVPVPLPAPAEDPESRRRCVTRHVARRGGHARHDAYALRVTHSAFDYYARTPELIAINYDGLETETVNVWEVKVGFGWFFNPAWRAVTDLTLARWDAQKNRGLLVGGRCGYVHLWAHQDRWVVGLLNSRWRGIPPVLNIR